MYLEENLLRDNFGFEEDVIWRDCALNYLQNFIILKMTCLCAEIYDAVIDFWRKICVSGTRKIYE